MPRVSVVMPVYNVAPYVEASVRSVLAQTFADFELIVVDDGSTDATPAIVEGIADPRIRLHRIDHSGLTAAENKGVELARGEFVARCDADDLFLPTLFERQIEVLDAEPNVVGVGAWSREFGARQKLFRDPPPSAAIRRGLRTANRLKQPVMVRVDAVRSAGGYRTTVWEDWDLWIRLAAKHELRNIPEFLVLLRVRRDSLFRSAPRIDARRAKLAARRTAARELGLDARSAVFLAMNAAVISLFKLLDRGRARVGTERPGPATPPPISVVVPTYRRPDLLARCVEAALAQEPPPLEVVVVHRADDEPTGEFAGRWRTEDPERRRVVTVDRPGLVHALAQGTAHARGDVVAYLDDDAIPRPGWLFELGLAFLDPTVGGAGGRLVDHVDGREVEGRTRVVGKVTPYGRVIGRHQRRTDHYGDVDWLTGANMAFRRELAVHDEGLRMTANGLSLANDLDSCLAVKRAGARVLYSPWAVVEHHTTSFRDSVLGSRVAGPDVVTSAANHTYAVCKSASAWPRFLHAVYAYGIGAASLPGPVRAAVELARSPKRGVAMARRIPLVWRGRREGFRMARAWRRSPGSVVVAPADPHERVSTTNARR